MPNGVLTSIFIGILNIVCGAILYLALYTHDIRHPVLTMCLLVIVAQSLYHILIGWVLADTTQKKHATRREKGAQRGRNN